MRNTLVLLLVLLLAPAVARADESVSERFVVRAAPGAVQRAACSLPAGRTLPSGRAFVAKIDWDGTPMPCQPSLADDPAPLSVHLQPEGDDRIEVTLVVDANEVGATTALHDLASELQQRARVASSSVSTSAPDPQARTVYSPAVAMLAFVLALGGVGTLVAGASFLNTSNSRDAGAGLLVGGVASLALGGIIFGLGFLPFARATATMLAPIAPVR